MINKDNMEDYRNDLLRKYQTQKTVCKLFNWFSYDLALNKRNQSLKFWQFLGLGKVQFLINQAKILNINWNV